MALGDWYLNGTKLCPWGFSYKESIEVVGGDSRMLSGALRRDIVARKLNVSLSWENLEETHNGTYHAYNDLRALGTKSGTMTLVRPIGTSTGTEQFKVFCTVPSGDVAFRSAGTVFWNCDIGLAEA
jgi:hypothetical protein